MNRLSQCLQSISILLKEREISFALVGGIAVSAQAEPRFTRDVDLAVDIPNDRDAEALIRHLRTLDYHVLAIVEQEATNRLSTVRMTSSTEGEEGIVIDLLFASSGIEAEVVAQAEALDVFENLQIPVAKVGHLIALKILSRDDSERPQDAADLKSLIKMASDEEINRAEVALKNIQVLGFHRDRDLLRLFESALETFSPVS
ncbi:MAG: nucleotidyl transferase AbiEii/AbiGii toxin family protein [Myxococcota bacterium]|nr:nucleotidyl transferase AbiEii/AbiGii toxin family protein [Myxococcota bacterium]